MNDKSNSKMGRPKKSGNQSIELSKLVDVFKMSTKIPVSYKFLAQFNLLPKKNEDSGAYYADSLF